MKLRVFFILIILIPIFIGFIIDINHTISSRKINFDNQIEDSLDGIIDTNEERVADFITEMENDVLFLAQSEKVKNILNKNTKISRELSVMRVQRKSNIIIKEIENYILNYPNITLDNLMDDDDFQKIAVQNIGKRGYSGILDVRDFKIYFHIDPEFIGMSYDEIKENSKKVIDILNETKKNGLGRGFYNWTDSSGRREEKYMEAKIVSIETMDNISFISFVSSYVSDYLIVKNVSEDSKNYINKFTLSGKYDNILFNSIDNHIVYMSEFGMGLGDSFDEITQELIGIDYFDYEIKKGDVKFYGPFIDDRDGELRIMAISNVYDMFLSENSSKYFDGKIGSIVFIKKIEEINNILKKGNKYGESYLVDKNALLFTSLKFENVDLLVQEIKTNNIKECFFHTDKNEDSNVDEIIINPNNTVFYYLNFKGDNTIGSHRYFKRTDWCLISEINLNEFLFKPMTNNIFKLILFRFGVILFLSFIIIGCSFFIDKKYIFRKKNKKEFEESSFNRIFNFISKIIRVKKINLFWSFALGIILSTGVFYILNIIFGGWKNLALYDLLPDLMTLIILIMIFLLFFRFKNTKVRFFGVLGTANLILFKILEMFLQEFQSRGKIPYTNIWTIHLFFTFIGIFLLLIAIKGDCKNG